MISISAGVLLEQSKTVNDDILVFGSAHEHAAISVRILGDEFDLSKQEFQLQSQFIHLENNNGYVLHRHSQFVTIGYLFDTLNLGLSKDCFGTPDGKKFCTNDEYSLKFYINEKKVDDLRDYLIFEGDLILISYGDENQEEVLQQLKELKDRGFPFKMRPEADNYLKF